MNNILQIEDKSSFLKKIFKNNILIFLLFIVQTLDCLLGVVFMSLEVKATENRAWARKTAQPDTKGAANEIWIHDYLCKRC